VKFRGWACMAVAAAMIGGVSLAADTQPLVMDQATTTEELIAPVPPEETENGRATKECGTAARKPCDQKDGQEKESGGVAEIDEASKNTAHETGEEPIPEEGEAAVMVEEPLLVEWPPERITVEQEPETLVPKVIEPLWVRELTDINAGHNDSNPVWSPSGQLIAFERSIGDEKEIIIASPVGIIVQKVYLQLAGDNEVMEFFLPGSFDEASYNSGISWSPVGDRFVVMSNGGGGNYDLYLGAIGSDETKRLTEHTAKDGLAHWSPVDNHLVFISGRTGHGDIYLMDLASRALRRLTRGDKAFLYPRWSPDGQKIVMNYGSNDNHDIYLIGDVKRPLRTLKPLTTWIYDDLRPVWSPDGTKIAFYTNYNKEDDPKVWSLAVIAGDGSDPREGEELAMKVVATDIIPNVEQGPAWMPDSNRIVYVKNDRHAFNPIYIVDIEKRANSLLRTGAKMNHDVTCSVDGTIAFRAQVEQWDHIHVARVEDSERRFPSVH
jgi:Tol biopolymer transport system component